MIILLYCPALPEALPIRMVYERSCVTKMADFTMDNAVAKEIGYVHCFITSDCLDNIKEYGSCFYLMYSFNLAALRKG